jgi:hypothetical protein
MSFLVQFADGTKVWKPFGKDLADTQQFEEYCRSNRQLLPILMNTHVAARYMRETRKRPIDLVEPGLVVYVDLRSWNVDNEGLWYDRLPMPDKYDKQYVVKGIYGEYVNKKHSHIYITFPVFNETHNVDNIFVTHYGYITELRANTIEVTEALVAQFPAIRS